MTHFLRTYPALVLMLLVLGISPLRAESTSSGARSLTSEERIQRTLQQRFGPQLPVSHVRKAPLGRMYEFRMGDHMGYTDEHLSYFLIGDLIDGTTMKNLSEARLTELNRVSFEQLPLQYAIKTVRGNGKRKLAIFEDPNCGYCKLFQKEIRSLDNVTIYTFIYPVLGPDSLVKARQILCSNNPARAWQEWMLNHRFPEGSGNCKTALEQISKFAEVHHVNSTPTIFVPPSERVAGAIALEKLEQMFKASEK